MKFSVVIPSYEDISIKKSLQSVSSQNTKYNIEAIVVDGGSTKKVIRIIEENSDIVSEFIREPDDGVFDALNKGIRAANGDIVSFLGSDDELYDKTVIEKVGRVISKTDCDVCCGEGVYVDREGEVVRYWPTVENVRMSFFLGWAPFHPSVFIKKEVHREVGLFDKNIDISADYEMWVRIFYKSNFNIKSMEDILSQMTVGGQSNNDIRNILKGNYQKCRAWNKNTMWTGISAVPLTMLWRLPQYLMRK